MEYNVVYTSIIQILFRFSLNFFTKKCLSYYYNIFKRYFPCVSKYISFVYVKLDSICRLEITRSFTFHLKTDFWIAFVFFFFPSFLTYLEIYWKLFAPRFAMLNMSLVAERELVLQISDFMQNVFFLHART